MRTPAKRYWLALTALGLLALPMTWAGADDRKEPAAAPVQRVYDLRIVRVRSTPAKASIPSPFEASGSTTTATWPEMHKALGARGPVEVLLDQRMTGVSADVASAEASHVYPLKRFDNRSNGNEHFRFDRIESRISAIISTRDVLEYEIKVQWLHWFPKEEAVPSATSVWRGSHAPLAKGTSLFLVARQHIRSRPGAAEQDEQAEIYAILTASDTTR